MIKLPTKVGTQNEKTCQVLVDYVITDILSTYNIIVRRPLLNSFRLILVAYNLKM